MAYYTVQNIVRVMANADEVFSDVLSETHYKP